MTFVINNLKYDTDKMELISEKCKYMYTWVFELTGDEIMSYGKDVKLWKSKKGNWLLTYRADYDLRGVRMSDKNAKKLLMRYDLQKYEELFGELEEA